MADVTFDLRNREDGSVFRSIPVADFVDPDELYLGPPRQRFRKIDRGPWTDLVVSRIEPGVDGYEVFHFNDGLVRAELLSLGISKETWEAAPSAQRKAVVQVLTAIITVKSCVEVALRVNDLPRREAAMTLIQKVSAVVETEGNDNRGFAKRGQPEATWIFEKDLYRSVLETLSAAMKNGRADVAHGQPKARYHDPDWCKVAADSVNFILARGPFDPLPPVCTPEDAQALAEDAPSAVASRIFARISDRLTNPVGELKRNSRRAKATKAR